jgi:hypothetical protein
MGSNKWKTAFLVNFSDVCNHPVGGGMASAAIRSHSLVMHIGMTINTFLASFLKCQGNMALPAGDHLVLAFQRKPGGPVVKSQSFKIDLPAIRIVAIVATQAKIFPMR